MSVQYSNALGGNEVLDILATSNDFEKTRGSAVGQGDLSSGKSGQSLLRVYGVLMGYKSSTLEPVVSRLQ